MFYYSTNRQSGRVDFRDATINGQAPDKGLYFPEQIPKLPENFIRDISQYANEEIALQVMLPYIGQVIPQATLASIVQQTVNFEFPLRQVDESIASLELFHGPTLAFKDVGARFMSRCLAYFVQHKSRPVTVLVATSGDTGGAVADGFLGVEGVQVVILYPSGKVSRIQEMQLTTPGSNITAIEVAGSFDDCQRMVKDAFTDADLNKALFLTSANSINVARWLPQQIYYFFAWKQWADKNAPPFISVPSGNLGNLCAGLLAQRSGLPVSYFIAACNANDAMYTYLQHGRFVNKGTVHTMSNAMDVGNPSNFIRIMELFDHDHARVRDKVLACSVSDTETGQTIREVYRDQHYLLDPHGAVGYQALQRCLALHPGKKGFFLETAHPVKFHDVVEPYVGKSISMPASLKEMMLKKSNSVSMAPQPLSLKEYLLANNKFK